MTTEEFNLSEKINPDGWIRTKDVKEFIRRLKKASDSQDFEIMLEDGIDGDITISFSEFIDILAGDKLI